MLSKYKVVSEMYSPKTGKQLGTCPNYMGQQRMRILIYLTKSIFNLFLNSFPRILKWFVGCLF